MREDGRAAGPSQRREAAEVRTMAVRDRDPVEVSDASAEPADGREYEPRIALEERVDQRQIATLFDQERMHVPTGAVAEAVHAGRDFGHAGRAAPARCHGAKGFPTPCT